MKLGPLVFLRLLIDQVEITISLSATATMRMGATFTTDSEWVAIPTMGLTTPTVFPRKLGPW